MDEVKRKLVLSGLVTILVIAGVALSVVLFVNFKKAPVSEIENGFLQTSKKITKTTGGKIKQFSSELEFRRYLQENQMQAGWDGGLALDNAASVEVFSGAAEAPRALGDVAQKAFTSESAQRVSQTNVRTQGIDEPDVVKTDGQEIFYTRQIFGGYGILPMREKCLGKDCAISNLLPESKQETLLVNALPIEQLKKDSKIEQAGELLLFDKTLLIVGVDNLIAYDIADKTNPQLLWKNTISGDSRLQQARKAGNKLYVLESTNLNRQQPCPLEPMIFQSAPFTVACTDVYYSESPLAARTTITALELDIATGKVKQGVSFLASDYYGLGSTVYLSENNLYVAYPLQSDQFTLMLGFFRENKDLLTSNELARLEKVATYDLSQAAKLAELAQVTAGLEFGNSDEALKKRTEMENRLQSYMQSKKRELTRSGIVKIGLADLKIKANAEFAGTLLNEFAVDEFENNLRLAITVGQANWSENSPSAAEVVVLNGDLQQIGMLGDLGLGERIYSARFVGERGFLVTFRQTDPFYVLDLADPKKPQKTGELKIPGYSSYLHPLAENLMLGIGKEDQKVKLSLFDVKNSSQPQEIAKYTLDEYWSEALNNHRAFLADPQKKIFFLPGAQGGYVFSWQDNNFKLVLAAQGEEIQRALYLDDYLYMVGKQKIMVYSENNWEKVKELTL